MAPTPAAAASREEEKPVMVVGLDESEQSSYALEWTLRHFFSSHPAAFQLVLVHAKPSAASVVSRIGHVGAADALPFVESDLRKIAAGIVQKAKEMCGANSVREALIEVVEGDTRNAVFSFLAYFDILISLQVCEALIEVVEGDARNVLCDSVEKHHADMLVVGSHGYGTLKRVFRGSVSDYCAQHAHCTVMIVKKPKSKH